MAKTEGVRGMMKGNWTNCVRIIPNSAMKFFTYEQLTRCGRDAAAAAIHQNKWWIQPLQLLP
jgi:hypothetical protein